MTQLNSRARSNSGKTTSGQHRKIFHTPRLLSWESIIIIFPLSQFSFYYSAEGKPIKKNTTRTHQICPLSSPRLRWSAAKCKAEKSRGKQHRTARKGFAAVCVLCVYLLRAIIIRCNTYYSLITTFLNGGPSRSPRARDESGTNGIEIRSLTRVAKKMS